MRKLIDQILKFGVVGGIAFLIDYGVLMLLSQGFGIDPVLSAAMSFCVSLAFNYLASMRFVFEHRDDISRSREALLFIVLSAVGLMINEACMLVGVAALGSSAMAVTFTKLFATLVTDEHPKISSAASSRLANVLAWTHSLLTMPMGDPVTALSQGFATDPVEGRAPWPRIVPPGSGGAPIFAASSRSPADGAVGLDADPSRSSHGILLAD